MSDPVVQITAARISNDDHSVTLTRVMNVTDSAVSAEWDVIDENGVKITAFPDANYDDAVAAGQAYLAALAQADSMKAQVTTILTQARDTVVQSAQAAMTPVIVTPTPVTPAPAPVTPAPTPPAS